MTALALLGLGLHDLVASLVPARWSAARARGAAVGAAGAGVVLAALLLAALGLTPPVLGGAVLVAAALLLAWCVVGAERPTVLLGIAAVLGLVAAVEAALTPQGRAFAPAVLTAVAVAVAMTETANRLTRAVLRLAGRRPAAEAPLRGGRYIGPMERVLMILLSLAQAWPVIAALMAAKGIVRFPEISADRGDGSRAEEFLVGSLASWGIAALGAVLVWLAVPAFIPQNV